MQKSAISLVLLWAFLPAIIFAQVENNQDTIVVNKLEEVVISAHKLLVPKQDLIQQITIIKAPAISNNNSQTTASLIENLGNAFVQRSQAGGGSIIVRGFEASRVVLMVDGVRLNNLIYRSGHLQNVITIDNAILDKVEILNGPASTMYGSDALGGVVSMYTRAPQLKTGNKTLIKGNTFFRYGLANNELTGHAELNIGTKKFASLTTATYSKFGDLRMGGAQNPFYKKFGERPFYADRIDGRDTLIPNNNPLLQKFSGYTQYDILQKFLLKQNEYLQHQLNLQFSNSSNVPRYDRLTDPKGSGLNSTEWYYGPQTRLLAAYDVNYNKPEAFFNSIHANVSYQYVVESRHSRSFGKNNRSDRTEYVNVFGYTLDVSKQIKKNKLTLGLDGQFSMVKSKASKTDITTGIQSALDTRYPDGKDNMNAVALYAAHIGKFGKYITINDGIRIGVSSLRAHFNDTSFFNFPFKSVKQNTVTVSGNAGVLYAPTEKWKIAFLFNTGFRVPNIDDLSKVFESAPGILIVPNNKLKPEKTINGELNITKQFGSSVQWENVFWATYFIDAIQTGQFTYNGSDSLDYGGSTSAVYANQNSGKAYLFGFSSTVNADFSKHFAASFSINYTRGRVLTDTGQVPLDHVAPLFGRIGFNYHSSKVFAEIYSLFNGWKKLKEYSGSGEDNLQYATADGMPAWFTLNLKASYQPHKNIAIMAGFENMLDTQYRTFASGINSPGRNIYLSLKFNW
ncbi:MAG: TonB-dependent receptor [Sphingobacteriales bacterium]|nr:TonB-dependent receptor [Sphingobacteriales bacterium]